MSIVKRYVAKTILAATLLTTLIMVGILFILNLFNELRSIGPGEYHLYQAINYVLKSLPNLLYQFSSMLIVIGSLAGVAVLYFSNELTMMRIMGLSNYSLISCILTILALLILIISLLGEGITLHLQKIANRQQYNAIHNSQSMLSATGVWLHEGNRFMHIEQVINKETLAGITRYQFDQNEHLKKIDWANKAVFKQGHWIFQHNIQTIFLPKQIKRVTSPEAMWDVNINIHLLNAAALSPQVMSLRQLWQYSHYLGNNHLQAKEYEYEFWKRLSQPLVSWLIPCLMIPFVLRAMTPFLFIGRIIISIIFNFFIYFVVIIFGQLCLIYQWSSLLAASCPVVILFGLGCSTYVIYRINA